MILFSLLQWIIDLIWRSKSFSLGGSWLQSYCSYYVLFAGWRRMMQLQRNEEVISVLQYYIEKKTFCNNACMERALSEWVHACMVLHLVHPVVCRIPSSLPAQHHQTLHCTQIPIRIWTIEVCHRVHFASKQLWIHAPHAPHASNSARWTQDALTSQFRLESTKCHCT